MSDVGKHIAKYRKAIGMTQDELGERLHVTRQTISSWENGRTLPSVDMLSDIAEHLTVPVENLIYGRDIKNEPRDTSVYKKAIVASLIVIAVCIGLMLYIKPHLGYTIETYRVFPELAYMSIIRPLTYVTGAVCFMSVISLIADISLRNYRLRRCALLAGAIMLFAFTYSVAVVYSVLPGGHWIHRCWFWTAYHPYIFTIPGAALFFGFNRSV